MIPRHTRRRAAKLSESGEGKRGASSGKKRAAKRGIITWRRSAETHGGAVLSAIQTRRMKALGADPEGGLMLPPRDGSPEPTAGPTPNPADRMTNGTSGTRSFDVAACR
jgi:hypothetical protein